MGGKVYSYIRFSDARQAAGASTERQQDYAQRWAREHGLVLDESLTLRDEGLSAYHQKHVSKGALGVFLRAVEDGRVEPGSVLVVEGLDRLSRSEPLVAMGQLTEIIQAGITVATASDRQTYSLASVKAEPMRLLQSLMVMIRANEESETKSRRVRDAIRRQCEGWVAGTYRGLVRYGKTPGWLHVVDRQWKLIPERAAAVRLAVDLCLQGMGSGHIARRLHGDGLAIGAVAPTSGHLQRLFTHPSLIGEKHLELDGQTYILAGYYPTVIDAATWVELQDAVHLRGRRHVKGSIPSVLTGTGIAFCGYCGGPLKGQTMASKRKADGSLLDCHRRLQCVKVNSGDRCPVPGSCSAAPIERALIDFCSDLVNLQSLYRGDATAGPRAELAAARSDLGDITAKLERITDALLGSTTEAPATFIRRARELEVDQAAAEARLQAAERALSEASRGDIAGADARWRDIADGVHALDYSARMQARQLVADTFERIVLFRRGIRPHGLFMDVVLTARGGVRRLLRLNDKGVLLEETREFGEPGP